jgi:hypothetical protein
MEQAPLLVGSDKIDIPDSCVGFASHEVKRHLVVIKDDLDFGGGDRFTPVRDIQREAVCRVGRHIQTLKIYQLSLLQRKIVQLTQGKSTLGVNIISM